MFDFYINPSNPAYKSCGVEFIAEINGEKVSVVAAKKGFTVGDNQYEWGNDITNNIIFPISIIVPTDSLGI